MEICLKPEAFVSKVLNLQVNSETGSVSWITTKKIPKTCTVSCEGFSFRAAFSLRMDMKGFCQTWFNTDKETRNTFYFDVISKLYPRTNEEYVECCKTNYSVGEDVALKVIANKVQRLDLALVFNGFGIDNETLLFKLSSFYNNSCEANCVFSIIDRKIYVVTLREIEAGEELTINYAYGNENCSVEQRRKMLHLQCGFFCNCKRCKREEKCLVCKRQPCDVMKENLLCCTRCKSSFYCSVECQKTDWKQHKTVCKDMKPPVKCINVTMKK